MDGRPERSPRSGNGERGSMDGGRDSIKALSHVASVSRKKVLGPARRAPGVSDIELSEAELRRDGTRGSLSAMGQKRGKITDGPSLDRATIATEKPIRPISNEIYGPGPARPPLSISGRARIRLGGQQREDRTRSNGRPACPVLRDAREKKERRNFENGVTCTLDVTFNTAHRGA